jgi:aspartate-semialdehyde dehydrogenase
LDTIDKGIRSQRVQRIEKIRVVQEECDLVFSTMETKSAALWEPAYAKHGLPVLSAAANFRREPDIPVICPEINPHHLDILSLQKKKRGYATGFVCALASHIVRHSLLPKFTLYPDSGLVEANFTAMIGMQSQPYISGMDIINNLIPMSLGLGNDYALEFLRVFGQPTRDGIALANDIKMNLSLWQVPIQSGMVLDHHLHLNGSVTRMEVEECWSEFKGQPQVLQLPFSPNPVLNQIRFPDRPQPALDLHSTGDLSVYLGQTRMPDPKTLRFASLASGSNESRASELLLLASLMLARGCLPEPEDVRL